MSRVLPLPAGPSTTTLGRSTTAARLAQGSPEKKALLTWSMRPGDMGGGPLDAATLRRRRHHLTSKTPPATASATPSATRIQVRYGLTAAQPALATLVPV